MLLKVFESFFKAFFYFELGKFVQKENFYAATNDGKLGNFQME